MYRVGLVGLLLLLSACGDARDPAYICMTDCDHFCEDGIKGDECRRQMQLQRSEREREERHHREKYNWNN